MKKYSNEYELVSNFSPTGDQPQAIEKLVEGIKDGLKEQVLLGVTGSGKTFVMANIIKELKRPALILAHNKTLAMQLYNEFKSFFPNNRVEYFVSYYDYYQPEAYIVQTDTYIEKEMSINDNIEKLRASATASLFEDRNTIVIASVSCIYGLGNPEEYDKLALSLRQGQEIKRIEILRALSNIQYTRNDIDFSRSNFRVRGDVIDICPAYSSQTAIRVELFGDEIDKIYEFDILTGKKLYELQTIVIYPATQYAVSGDKLNNVLDVIAQDAETEVEWFKSQGKLIEAQRLKERVGYDLEMLREMGYCSGIENYSRYFDGRDIGQPPYTLLDYFPDDFLLFVDESHMTLPQIRGMYNGDKSRKTSLVNYGFRLKSAFDNRPLTFEEFNSKLGQIIYVSATPAKYELDRAGQVVECLIRPTGLLDPVVEVRPTTDQIDDLMNEICNVTITGGKVLVTTLTKKMSESLTDYFKQYGIKTKYLHSEIDTIERTKTINELRKGEFDVIVGINLLREGLDIPEVELVAILDADKEGFLRSSTSLIQTIGRAARNAKSRVIMYADEITDSMKYAINETSRRRKIQEEYNIKNNIIPKTIIKDIKEDIGIKEVKEDNSSVADMSLEDILDKIDMLKHYMKQASDELDFEKAITLREEIAELKNLADNIRKDKRNQRFIEYLKNKNNGDSKK